MKELSLNILDVAENSVRAGAKNILISLFESEDGFLTLVIEDDGCGMDEETLKSVSDPFYTTRTTRKIGLGIPFLKLASNQAGGDLTISSTVGCGTTVKALFDMNSVDFTPIGDIISTLTTLIMGSPDIDFTFDHSKAGACVHLATKELREVLGDVSLASFEVISWIRDYLSEQYDIFGGKSNENFS